MTSTPTQPVEPLTEIFCTSNITAAADGVLEDEEARWKRWCIEAGVPDAYTPPGKAEAGRVAKKVKEAKKKRLEAMRKSIARANAAAAAAARADKLEPPPPPQAAPDAAAPDAAAPEVDSASAPRVDDEDEHIFLTQMPAGRSQTGLVVQLRRREIEILHRAMEVESWGQDCAFFVRVFYGKERGFVGQRVRAVRCAASGAEWVVLDDGLATTVRLASLANDLFKISELKDVVRRIHAGEIADPSLAAID